MTKGSAEIGFQETCVWSQEDFVAHRPPRFVTWITGRYVVSPAGEWAAGERDIEAPVGAMPL